MAAYCVVFLLTSATTGTLAFQTTTGSSDVPLNRPRCVKHQLANHNNDMSGMDAYDAQMAAMMKDQKQPMTTTTAATTTNAVGNQSQSSARTSSGATKNGMDGMDAFEAQLAAMNQKATTHTTDDSQSYFEVESQSTSATTTTSTSNHRIGGLLLQRAIQTQLYYLADLRDEPTYMWLRGFLGHDHLDDRGKFNKLDGLHCSNWRSYLPELEQAPPFTIVVELAPPKLSAQQKRNPHLAKQVTGRSYEETIQPTKLSQTIRTVSRSMVETEWVPVLLELATEDRRRVQIFDLGYPYLHSTWGTKQAAAAQQVVAGGEGDDQETPLFALNSRIVTRFCTRIALYRIVEELQGVSAEESHTDDDQEFAAAHKAAVKWLTKFVNEWVPKLKHGPDDDVLRSLGKPAPGQYKRLCQEGVDADDVTEALWQELPQLFAENAMNLFSPEALAMRLRRARANVCDELVDELRVALAAEFQ